MVHVNAQDSPGVQIVKKLTGKGFENAVEDVMKCSKFDAEKQWIELEGCVGNVRDGICSGKYSGDAETDCGDYKEGVKWVGMVEVLNHMYCEGFGGCRKEIAEHFCSYYEGNFRDCVNFYIPEKPQRSPGVQMVIKLAGEGFDKATEDVMECAKFDPATEWQQLESCVEGVRADICSGKYSGSSDTKCDDPEAVKWVGMVEVINEIYCEEHGCRKEIAQEICKYYDGDYEGCVNFYTPGGSVAKRKALPKLPPISKKSSQRQASSSLKDVLEKYLSAEDVNKRNRLPDLPPMSKGPSRRYSAQFLRNLLRKYKK